MLLMFQRAETTERKQKIIENEKASAKIDRQKNPSFSEGKNIYFITELLGKQFDNKTFAIVLPIFNF